MTFRPGQSGNPAGRPRKCLPDGRSLSDLAKEHTATAVQALVGILEDQASPPSAVVQAATALLDRGWGRPQQAVLVDQTMGSSLVEELEAARRRAIAHAQEQRANR